MNNHRVLGLRFFSRFSKGDQNHPISRQQRIEPAPRLRRAICQNMNPVPPPLLSPPRKGVEPGAAC